VTLYSDAARELQDRFDTRRLADRLEEKFHREVVIDDDRRALIERLPMFFLATADAEGRPQCSYKGGEPGFVRVLDERTIAFPDYDGNGMYLSLGNLVENPQVGLLFIDFTCDPPRRLRLNGVATIDDDDPLLAEYEGALLIVRVHATSVFGNCPRYIHRMELVAHSRHTPRANHEPPIPAWKTTAWAKGVLKANDPANALHQPEGGADRADGEGRQASDSSAARRPGIGPGTSST